MSTEVGGVIPGSQIGFSGRVASQHRDAGTPSKRPNQGRALARKGREEGRKEAGA
jgi:hypothetical protein